MYIYRFICRFLKQCGALIRVALVAEALGADGLLSDPGPCKTSSVGQSAGLLISRSSVRFRQKLKKSRTQIYMDLSHTDPHWQARVLNHNVSNDMTLHVLCEPDKSEIFHMKIPIPGPSMSKASTHIEGTLTIRASIRGGANNHFWRDAIPQQHSKYVF